MEGKKDGSERVKKGKREEVQQSTFLFLGVRTEWGYEAERTHSTRHLLTLPIDTPERSLPGEMHQDVTKPHSALPLARVYFAYCFLAGRGKGCQEAESSAS